MKFLAFVFFYSCFSYVYSQQPVHSQIISPITKSLNQKDSLKQKEFDTIDTVKSINTSSTFVKVSFNARPLIFPTVLIAYSEFALNNHGLRHVDLSTKNMIDRNTHHFKSSIDNYSQYAPALAVYGLNSMGIKGKNNFVDRSIMYGLTTVITGIAVTGIKHWASITRPDGTAANSFPSGHTTTAFAAAEFLHQEYKNRSVWYSIAGYATATATGIVRMYNNRHFLSDVVCGAGLGMLSTKLVYIAYPAIKKKFSKRSMPVLVM